MSKQLTKPSDNKMLALLGKTVILCIIPKTIDTVYDAFFGTTRVPEKEEETKISYTTAEVDELLREQQKQLAPRVEIPTQTPTPKKEGTHSIGNSIVKSAAANAKRVTKDTFSKPPVKTLRKRSKKYDMTPLTKEHMDVVSRIFDECYEYNKGRSQRNSRDYIWITKHLNKLFKLDKSYPVYSAVAHGHRKRSAAPDATYDIFNPPVVK